MATVYVSQAALSQGRTSEPLEISDLDALCDEIRRAMAPFTSRNMLEDVIAQITASVRP